MGAQHFFLVALLTICRAVCSYVQYFTMFPFILSCVILVMHWNTPFNVWHVSLPVTCTQISASRQLRNRSAWLTFTCERYWYALLPLIQARYLLVWMELHATCPYEYSQGWQRYVTFIIHSVCIILAPILHHWQQCEEESSLGSIACIIRSIVCERMHGSGVGKTRVLRVCEC